jgi:hypothetical protein
MVLRRAEGEVFSLPIHELLYGSPAPLYGVKRLAALNHEAACYQSQVLT